MPKAINPTTTLQKKVHAHDSVFVHPCISPQKTAKRETTARRPRSKIMPIITPLQMSPLFFPIHFFTRVHRLLRFRHLSTFGTLTIEGSGLSEAYGF